MKHFKEDFIRLYQNERLTLVIMGLNLLLSLLLIFVSIINLSPESATMKVGYGDIGGYRDGVWSELLVFPALWVVLGVFHGFIAVDIFHKRGAGMAKFFLLTTLGLIIATFVVFIRLMGEN